MIALSLPRRQEIPAPPPCAAPPCLWLAPPLHLTPDSSLPCPGPYCPPFSHRLRSSHPPLSNSSTSSCTPGSTFWAKHVHIFIFTHSCNISSNLKTFLELCDVPSSVVHTLLHSLSINIVRSTHGLICLRRQLDRDPATFLPASLAPSAQPSHTVSSLHPFHDPP